MFFLCIRKAFTLEQRPIIYILLKEIKRAADAYLQLRFCFMAPGSWDWPWGTTLVYPVKIRRYYWELESPWTCAEMLSWVCVWKVICFLYLSLDKQGTNFLQLCLSYTPAFPKQVKQKCPAIREHEINWPIHQTESTDVRVIFHIIKFQRLFYSHSYYDIPLPNFKAITAAPYHASSFTWDAEQMLNS